MNEKDSIPGFSITALKAGNEQAFAALFRHFYKPLCYFAERMVKKPAAAEDIVAETFIKFWNRLEQFESLQHIKSFLYKTSRNVCLDYIKLGQRADFRERLFVDSLDNGLDDIDHERIRVEVLNELYQAIQRLPRQCSKVISMSYIDGLRNSEIADNLGISIQTVKNQKSRGIKILQGQFPKYSSCLIPIYLYMLLG